MNDPQFQPRWDDFDSTVRRMKRDGMTNLISGMGGPDDFAGASFYTQDRILEYSEIDALYIGQAVAARIVDKPADDSVRNGFDFVARDGVAPNIEDRLNEDNVLQDLGQAFKSGSLYGTGMAVMLVDDGLPSSQPLNLNYAKRFLGMEVVDCTHTVPVYDSSVSSIIRPEYYDIYPITIAQSKMRVHRSRVIRFDGVKVPPRIRSRYFNGFSPSKLQRPYKSIIGLDAAVTMLDHLLHVCSSTVMYVPDLKDKLKGDAGELAAALRNIKRFHNAYNIFLTDANHKMEEISRNISGAADIVERRVDSVVRDSDQPRLVILGESPHGMNASGRDEYETHKTNIRALQKRDFTPAVNRVLSVIFACYRNAGLVNVPTSWSIEWRPISEPNDKDRAEVRLKNAQSRALDISSQVVDTRRAALDPDVDKTYPQPQDDDDDDIVEAPPTDVAEPDDVELPPPNPVPAGAYLVTIAAASQQTGLTRGQIKGFIKRGQIASYGAIGSNRREVDLNEVLAQRQIVSAAV